MITFTAPAWQEKELSNGAFTYTPVLHPKFSNSVDNPCPTTCINVEDDTPFSTDVWQGTTGLDGVQIYTLIAFDKEIMDRGMLTLSGVVQCDCVGTCTNGTCQVELYETLTGPTKGCKCG